MQIYIYILALKMQTYPPCAMRQLRTYPKVITVKLNGQGREIWEAQGANPNLPKSPKQGCHEKTIV